MNADWVVIDVLEVAWIALAFALGLGARVLSLPPLVGYLIAGFLIAALGGTQTVLIERLADLGITLLLFTIGLKLNIQSLVRPQVFAVTLLHMVLISAVLALLLFALAVPGLFLIDDLDMRTCALVAFALSFSSTVFVVKVLEEAGATNSLQGRIGIGILVMQDIAAVAFIAISSGKLPTLWALALPALFFLRRPLQALLPRVGHGEMMTLYGFVLALGMAELFELVGLKGDIGALIAGLLIAGHAKSDEMSKTMSRFKDLFLLGFFLSIGLASPLSWHPLITGVLLTPLVLLKSALFFALLTAFGLRARTALLTTLNLSNYSEFGLIVAAVGVSTGALPPDWLAALSIAVALSFLLSATLNANFNFLYSKHRDTWNRLQRRERIADDHVLDIGGARVAVIGMGGIGTGAYQTLAQEHGDGLIGVDIDSLTVAAHQRDGLNVVAGDPGDADFWERVHAAHDLEQVLLALPNARASAAVLEKLRDHGFDGRVDVIARFDDESADLLQAGADSVFNVYAESGAGFARACAHSTKKGPRGPSLTFDAQARYCLPRTLMNSCST